MIEIEGKQVPTTLEEIIDPKCAALIVIDIQNDYCSPDGKYARGKDTSWYPTMVEPTAALINAARQNGVLVIYLQNTNLPGHRSDSVAFLRYKLLRVGAATPEELSRSEWTLEGTWGWQIVDEIAPQPDDLVVKKHRSSAFVDTRLDMLLRSNNIQTVLITGLVTEGCVQSNALDASFHDYIVVLVEDCIGSCRPRLHTAALEVMRSKFDVATSDQIIQAWAARPFVKSQEN